MIEAFSEQLITIDELRTRMPDLRARETNLRNQISALDTQHADREHYLTLATDVQAFLATLHHRADTATIEDRQRVLRLVVKDVLIGPENITVRHRIPVVHRTAHEPETADTEGDHQASYPLRYVMAPWKPGGSMSTLGKRSYRRSRGRPTWRIIRYADDFVILVHGSQEHTEALREDVATLLAPLGLRLSAAKTQVVHMSDGFDFLGFRIRWKRKRGTNKWYVYTFIADRPLRSLKAKIRALTHKTSQWSLAYVLTRLGQIMRGWANYFKHAVAKWTFSKLGRVAQGNLTPGLPQNGA